MRLTIAPEWICPGLVDPHVHLREPGGEEKETIIVALNFTPEPRPAYRIGVPRAGTYVEALNTDAEHYGGSGVTNELRVAEPIGAHGKPYSFAFRLPPLATVIFRFDGTNG